MNDKDKKDIVLAEPRITKKKWDDLDEVNSDSDPLKENYEAYSFGGGYSLDE